jgi:diaminopimelate decarboxylase
MNVIKQTTVFAGVDSGFNHFNRPMLYGSQIDISTLKGKERFIRLWDTYAKRTLLTIEELKK